MCESLVFFSFNIFRTIEDFWSGVIHISIKNSLK